MFEVVPCDPDTSGHIPGQPSAASEDKPRIIVAPAAFGDKIFRGILRSAGPAS